MYVYKYICMYVYKYICMYVYKYIHTYVCVVKSFASLAMEASKLSSASVRAFWGSSTCIESPSMTSMMPCHWMAFPVMTGLGPHSPVAKWDDPPSSL